MSNPSVKQFRVIQMIEENTPNRFKGKTMAEAREFISNHIEESKEATKRYKEDKITGIEYEHVLMRFIPPEEINPYEDELIIPEKEPEIYREEDNPYAWGTGLGDVTGEPRNNGHFGMPDPE